MERDAPTSRLEMLPQAFEIAKNVPGNGAARAGPHKTPPRAGGGAA